MEFRKAPEEEEWGRCGVGLLNPKDPKLSLSRVRKAKSPDVAEGLTVLEFVCYLSSELAADGQP